MLHEVAPVARVLVYNFFHDLYFKDADYCQPLFYKKNQKNICLRRNKPSKKMIMNKELI